MHDYLRAAIADADDDPVLAEKRASPRRVVTTVKGTSKKRPA